MSRRQYSSCLSRCGRKRGEVGGELLEHVAVVVVQELAQAFVVLGIGARQHAHEGGAAVVVAGQRQRRAHESIECVFERVVRALARAASSAAQPLAR